MKIIKPYRATGVIEKATLDKGFKPSLDISPRGEVGGITTTEVCNLECAMCHFNGPGAEKKFGVLSTEQVKKFLEGVDRSVTNEIWFASTGEFFMDKDALVHLRNAVDLGLRPCVLTNGQLWTDDLIEEVLQIGVRFVRMSVDSCRPDRYRKIRKGAEFSKILGACEYFRVRKKEFPDIRVEINATLLPHTLDEVETMVEFWKERVDGLNVNNEYFDTFKFRSVNFEPSERGDCKIQPYLLPNGYIAPCCAMQVYQHDNDTSWLPHIDTSSLEEAESKLREMYLDKRSELSKICRKCQWWILWQNGKDNVASPYLQCFDFSEKNIEVEELNNGIQEERSEKRKKRFRFF